MSSVNVLYINSHDTGRFVEPYGYAIPTPHLMRLSREGVLFRQAFCAGPTCSPSRAALLTGCYPHENGMLGLAHRGFGLNDYDRHIVTTLKSAGYLTALSGFQHVAQDVSRIGYDRLLHADSGDGGDAAAAEAAARFLKGRPEGPFYLEVGFHDTHRDFPPPDDEADVNFARPPSVLPDTPDTRYDMACFKASARRLDGNVGIVLDALGESGLAGETLVICTTDHGIAFPWMKCSLFDGGIGVMLMMRGPGGFGGGRVVDALVSHVDVYATICEAAGARLPQWCRGSSLAPPARGESREAREEIFAEVNYHAAYEPQRCVRTRRWKYIRRYGPGRVVLPNIDDGPSKDLLLHHGLRGRAMPEEALYDLVYDPNEAANLASEAAAAEALAEMRARLERWMRETEDPMLEGLVSAPRGARVNDADGLSSTEKPLIAE